jgi:UDP-N-acetylglucosamine/UDP-N-acetylgalactosamine diphosphorylase
MPIVPDDLRQKLRQYGQEHVLAWWPGLSAAEQENLLAQLRALDLDALRKLYESRDQTTALPALDELAPIPSARLDPRDAKLESLGEEGLRRGEIAALVVAGGQGTRLGFDQPKGMYPIGPVSQKSLFQIHAEKILALNRRYGTSVPFLVMTSPATDEETREYFAEQGYFGLPSAAVTFFCQGTMPALDLAAGKLLMETAHELCLSPNGHGGTLQALADQGLLQILEKRGVRQVFYFQVDNPLVKIADPTFLGHHRSMRAEVSSKGVIKVGPTEKMGNLVLVNGRCGLIEYSDLPQELAHATNPDGQLRFRLGSPAIHIFDLEFLKRVTQGPSRMPYHLARKRVEYLDKHGGLVGPAQENALKFELFIFDVLPHAERWAVVETERREEFEPLKNATGANSPASVRQAISNLSATWLEHAGIAVPRQPSGDAIHALEISPLFAIDPDELAAKIDRGLRVDRAICLD